LTFETTVKRMTISRHGSQTNALLDFGVISLEHRGHVMPAKGRQSAAVSEWPASRSVVLIAVTIDLIRNLALALILVLIAQGSVDERCKKDEGADEINDFHCVLPMRVP
jgi:hypothetical protein